MNKIGATYFANYEDYDGFDEVPCIVDLDSMEVIEFGPAKSCRWDENVMCISEVVALDDGREFDAIKFDEYNDAVDGGYADESNYNREDTILFDSDALEAACQYLLGSR